MNIFYIQNNNTYIYFYTHLYSHDTQLSTLPSQNKVIFLQLSRNNYFTFNFIFFNTTNK